MQRFDTHSRLSKHCGAPGPDELTHWSFTSDPSTQLMHAPFGPHASHPLSLAVAWRQHWPPRQSNRHCVESVHCPVRLDGDEHTGGVSAWFAHARHAPDPAAHREQPMLTGSHVQHAPSPHTPDTHASSAEHGWPGAARSTQRPSQSRKSEG